MARSLTIGWHCAGAESVYLGGVGWLLVRTNRAGGGERRLCSTPLDDSTTKWHHAKAVRPLADMLGHRAVGVSVGYRVRPHHQLDAAAGV